jgi:aspartate/methionine/tyrosine aminotransferase
MGTGIVRQGKNTSTSGPAFENSPDDIIEAAVSALKNGHTHQTRAIGTSEFRAACAEKLKRENNIDADPEREIIATSGVKQGLTLALAPCRRGGFTAGWIYRKRV